MPDDTCWPVDSSCCDDWNTYDGGTQSRAVALAVATLRSLTAYRVGGCPVTVRPCAARCWPSDQGYWTGGMYSPVLYAGTWVNSCGCPADGCSCTALCRAALPPPVGAVGEVKVDGVVLPPTAYTVQEGRYLIRLDGGCWPACQDLTLPDTDADTFSVTYQNSAPVDGLLSYAAGVLACEFAKACTGAACRLPAGVTSVVRQGVAYTVGGGMFPDGSTGIREVDAVVRLWNPQAIRQWAIWSPDTGVNGASAWRT